MSGRFSVLIRLKKPMQMPSYTTDTFDEDVHVVGNADRNLLQQASEAVAVDDLLQRLLGDGSVCMLSISKTSENSSIVSIVISPES